MICARYIFSANRRCFANGTAPLQTRTGNLLQTRPANASRHSEPPTGHPELDSGSVPPFPHLPQIPGQARNDVPKPHPQDKKNPGSQNHREKSQTKRLFVCSRRKFLLTASSINCSLCSLKFLSIALLAELADCTLSSVNSFLCSTVYKSL